MKRFGLNIEIRNINQHEEYREELIREGGKRTVPCLKIVNEDQSVTWLYESGDISGLTNAIVQLVNNENKANQIKIFIGWK